MRYIVLARFAYNRGKGGAQKKGDRALRTGTADIWHRRIFGAFVRRSRYREAVRAHHGITTRNDAARSDAGVERWRGFPE